MTSLKWFVGDSKEALRQMAEHNYASLIYIGKSAENNNFNDPIIIKLLNDEHISCHEIYAASPECNDFNDIFTNVVIPFVYLLKRNNVEQRVIKERDFTETRVIIISDSKNAIRRAF